VAGLRWLRLQRGLTLEQVEVLTGVNVATLSRIERGLQEPRPETVVALAKGLRMSARRMSRLLTEAPEPSEAAQVG
jgi:transcriptional regulator with XRE-family HTH domain